MSPLQANDNSIKIRSVFNIKNSFCEIMTNGVLGMDNRDSAYAGRGNGISSTNAFLFLENGENEISVDIGALAWFSNEKMTISERKKFNPLSSCKVDLIMYDNKKNHVLSTINIVINQEGIPELVDKEGVQELTDNRFYKIQAEQVTNGHIDPNYFWERYFPEKMELYRFTKKITLNNIPQWAWIKATPFTGSDDQIIKLRKSYLDVAKAINNHDRNSIKKLHEISLKAWAIATEDSEDDILKSQYTSEEIEQGKANINPIKWEDYSLRIMNKGRLVQMYNKSDTTYSPLSFYMNDEDGKKTLYSYAPVFSLINGKFVVVL